MMCKNIEQFVVDNKQNLYHTIQKLCSIPAPSHLEEKRAEYCKKWLEHIGAKGVYIDEALNVVFPLNCENSNQITVFVAHTDTVFPDTEPMPYFDDGEKIHSPGVADNTASVAVLLLMAKYYVENDIMPPKGILFVCNSCEEGLGNLKGVRQIVTDFEHRIKQFVSFDSNLDVVNDVCVGSQRYQVEIFTEGGHSYGDFGKKNAIHVASKMVNEIYKINIPQKKGTKTTYNVGTFSGGTSVNTIAQNVKFLCEYRSDDVECLSYMQKQFEEIFEQAKEDGVRIEVANVGDRPCANIDAGKIEELKNLIVPEIERIIDKKVSFKSSSTDCNIPLSKGIPSVCVGVSTYQGMHTREEWVNKASIATGLNVAIHLGEKLTKDMTSLS